MYRKLYSNIAFIIYKILFKVPLKDPSYAFVLMERKVYQSLSSFKPKMPDGFFWEFNARAFKKGFNFFNLDNSLMNTILEMSKLLDKKNIKKFTIIP